MSVVTTGQITVTDQNDGVSAKLTLESFVAPTAPDGSSPVLTGASTTVTVFLGATDDSSNWTVVASPSSGVSGSLSGRTYTVSGLTVDAGYVDLTASRSGYSSVTMRFAVSKAKKGNRGTVSAARAISGTAWSDSEAAAAITAVASDSPVQGDVVTLYNSASAYSETRQRSASSWSALTKYLNGNLVVDGTVSAGAIAADAITASKMLIEDNSNIVPDADYEDAAAWVLDSVNTTETVVAATSEWNSANLLQVDAASNALGIVRGKTFKVRPGDKLFWEGQLMVNGGTGNCYVQIQYSASRNMSSPVTTNTAISSATVPTTLSGEITVPAGVRFARVRLVKNSNGTTSALFGRLVLRKKADAELIVDGSIVAGKIAVGTITADKIAVGAITADKIVVTDFENLAGDANFDDQSFWTTPATTTFITATAGFTSRNIMQLSGASNAFVVPNGMTFQVKAGDKLFMSLEGQITGGSGRCYAQVQFSANTDFSLPQYRSPPVITSTSVTTVSGEITVPGDMRYARLRLVKGNDGVTQCRFGNVIMRRMNGGELIVDGSIISTKIAAGAVEADKIAANAITADKIAAGAITAREIAAQTIVASKLAVTDLTNLVLNSELATSEGWALEASVVVAYAPAGMIRTRALEIGAVTVTRFARYTAAVDAGAEYVLSCQAAGTTGGTFTVRLGVIFRDAAGVQLTNPGATVVTLTNATPVDVWDDFTAPAGAVTAEFRFGRTASGSEVGLGYIANPTVRRKNGAELIVDGSITADKIQTGAITAGKISADSITVSKILVQDNSNIVPDADFDDLDVWTSLAGTRAIEVAPAGWDSTNVLRVRGAAGEIVGTVGKPFRVRAGDTLSIEAQMAVTGGVIGASAAELFIVTSTKRDMSNPVSVSAMTTASNTPVTQKATFVVPNDIRFAQVFVRKLAGSVTEVTLGRIVIRNRSTTDLLEDNAVSTIREVTINNTATITAGAGWVTHGSYTFTPSGNYPISLWMTGKGTITLPTGVFGSLDVRIYWRGVLTFTYTGSLSGTGAQTLTGLVTANDRFESGGGTSGTLEVQVRANGANCQFTGVRILLGEFKK